MWRQPSRWHASCQTSHYHVAAPPASSSLTFTPCRSVGLTFVVLQLLDIAVDWATAELPDRKSSIPIASHVQERFYFGDNAAPLFESGIPLLKKQLAKLPDADNITIAYPDEGAWKRFKYQFSDYPEVLQGPGSGTCARANDGDLMLA